ALTRVYYVLQSRAERRGGEGQIDAYDAVLGVRLIPNSRGRKWSPEFDVEFRINAQGFRMDRDVRADGRSRIVVVGDSFTFGDGVDVLERYGDRLESLTGHEVINMGVWGYGTDQSLLMYRQEAGKYTHDLVILGFLLE